MREEPQASSTVLHQENALSPSSRVLPKESIQPFGIGELCGASWLERLLFTMLPLGINVKKKAFCLGNLCADVLHELNMSEQKDLPLEVFYLLMFVCT